MKIKKKGFTLLEVIFAVAILGMVIVMIYPSMTSSFDLFRRAKDIDVVNNFATNNLETFKKDPVEFWKKVNLSPQPPNGIKYDDKGNIVNEYNTNPVYYYQYTYGNKADNKFLYFDNDFKPLSEAEKAKAIYKMKVWGSKKSFSKVTTNLIPEKNTQLPNIDLSKEYNYFETYKLPNHGEDNEPYDLGFISGKDAKWVEDFLFFNEAIDSPSNMKEPSKTGIVTKNTSYRELTASYAKANNANHLYYMNMRSEGYEWFMHRFFRVDYISDPNFPQDKLDLNFDYNLTSKSEPINVIMNVNELDIKKVTNIDFRNRLDNPIELYLVYDAKSFKPSGGQSVISLLMNNVKLNVLDNDVNITFLSNESTLKNEHELFLELYRIDKKTNKEKKYDTFKVKTLI